MQYRFFLLLIILFLYQGHFVYSQTNNNNISQNAENIDTSDIFSFTRDNVKENSSTFTTLIGIAPLAMLKKFATENNIEHTDDDTEITLRQKIIKEFLDITPTIDTTQGSQSVPRNIIDNMEGNIVLYHADIVEAYELEDIDEEVLLIYGNVRLKMHNYNIQADNIAYSTATGEVFGSGNIVMTSPSSDMTGSWFLVNKDSNVGVLYDGSTVFQTFIIDGNILKFKDDVFIAEDALITFSKLTPPAHSLTTQRVLLWDEKKIMTYNSTYSIGEQPLIWVPFLMQNNFGTGIISTLGQSTREGMYVQNRKTFTTGNVKNTIRFDAYQKLGFLLGDELRYSALSNTINFDAMIALGRKYELLEGTPSIYYTGSYYNNYFLPDAITSYTFRYYFDYSQSFVVHQNDFMTTKISGNLLFSSDLYFKSDFYNIREGTGIFDVITSAVSSIEDIGSQTAQYAINNDINIVNSGKNHNITVMSGWDLEAVRNLSVNNNQNFDYEKPMTTSIILPSISASYNNILGSDNDYYLHGLNINYDLSADYSRTITFKPTDGIYFNDNPNLDDDLNDILSEQNVFNINGSASRTFTNSFLRYTPTIDVGYNNQTTANPTSEESIYDKENTYTSLSAINSLSLFLPNDLFDKEVYEYFSPNFSFNTTYSMAYKFKEEYYDYDSYGMFSQNSITSSLSVGGTLYGLFFIPKLNLTVLNTTMTGYDLRPNYNAFDKEYSFEQSEYRILTTYTSANFKLFYDNSYISYDIYYNILENNLTKNAITTYIDLPIKLKDAITYMFSPLDKKGKIEKNLTAFDLFFGFTYRHDFETYLYNYMDFRFGINFTINELWKFEFAVNSRNSHAFRYIQIYAEAEGYQYVNFFDDIVNSFSFANTEKISSALFKLESIEASLWHDLDGWDVTISFAIKPESLPSDLTTGSIKGYYWSQELWIEFKLTEFDGIAFPRIEPNLNEDLDELY